MRSTAQVRRACRASLGPGPAVAREPPADHDDDLAAPVLAGYRRTADGRGGGPGAAVRCRGLAGRARHLHRPRLRGRGFESDKVAAERGRLDAVIAGLLFMAGMQRSEVALRWAGPTSPTRPTATARRSRCAGARPNQEGDVKDVRYVKDGAARAIRTWRAATNPEAADRVVPLSAQMIGLRFYDRGCCRRRRPPGDRALGAGRPRIGADEPGRGSDDDGGVLPPCRGR